MQTKLNPTLSFRDKAREAMSFYKTVFGGNLTMSTFKEYKASEDPKEDDKIMHAVSEADNGIAFMAADTPNRMEYKPGANMSMALGGDNDKDLTACFERLSAGGKVRQHLAKTPWGETFGMLTDKFPIDWR